MRQGSVRGSGDRIAYGSSADATRLNANSTNTKVAARAPRAGVVGESSIVLVLQYLMLRRLPVTKGAAEGIY